MDKTVLRNFAIESRKDLMEKIDRKIKLFYVDEEFKKDNRGDVIVLSNNKHSLTLTKEEDSNRDKLIKRIVQLGYEQVIEEAAYTWFNRIIAIRYMEVHDYLPLSKDNQSLGINVLSSKDDNPNPDILKISNIMNPDLDLSIDRDYYAQLSKEDDKFKYILLLVCNKLGKVIPEVFDGVTDYIDLLIPDNMLNDGGFVNRLLNTINKSNFDEVEIIGWLYQYYISEKKDDVFAKLKKNIKISKENVPSATQIFTPDWIVKYMVENTLGRYADENIANNLKYYVKNSDNKNSNKPIENIKFIDPCCGSGHILVYAYKLLYEMYLNAGYSKNLIPELILNNNLYGVDIDDRACQLSILSVLLKARENDKNLFNKKINLNIISIQESNNINIETISDLLTDDNKNVVNYILDVFKDAKEYGSILKVNKEDYLKIISDAEKVDNIFYYDIKNTFIPLIKQAIILSNKYDVVVTNPPYMGNRGMDAKLTDYVKKYYNDYKTDMFSVFIKKASELAIEDGYYAMITQPTFLFLSSFEKIRKDIIDNETIISLLHMGRGIFGVDFGSTSFVIQKKHYDDYYGSYYRLNKRTFQYIEIEDIEKIFLNAKDDEEYTFDFNKYKCKETTMDSEDEESTDDNGVLKIKFKANQSSFDKIPGRPFSYWISSSLIKDFENKTINDYANVITGMTTGDNNKFLKLWYEIDYNGIAFDMKDQSDMKTNNKYWYPYSKGGNRRKWFGNYDYIVNWSLSNQFNRSKTTLKDLYFKKALTWPFISSGKFSARILDTGFLWDVAGSPCFVYDDNLYNYILGLLNTNIADEILKLVNPTINVQAIDLMKIPVIIDDNSLNKINNLVNENIDISKKDWNDYEISWDFIKNPLLGEYNLIKNSYINYYNNKKKEFIKLKSNEEELNKEFLKIYGLENEYSYLETDDDVTIKVDDQLTSIKNFISYAVGCMFGRYSLDKNGLIFAGGKYDKGNYKLFSPDEDNIIPISDNENIYYNDDIVGKFKSFVEIVFGKDTINENLEYIATTLGKRGTESSEETIRRYFVNDFYNDHIKMYQKKPIYWLFDSGKKNGFKCLVYLHRYDEQIVSKIRTKYLHNTLSIYQRTVEEIDYKLNNGELSTTDKRELQNKKVDLNGKITECNEYEEMVGNVANKMIKLDLDDGVVVNYSKFIDDNGKSILAKIK